jgi:hypothetical protein
LLNALVRFKLREFPKPEGDGKPWVRRTFPCVWALMKRRRAKDYNKLWKVLIKKSKEYNLIPRPES